MTRAWQVLRTTVVKFYDDQMTHHAAALTYYGLMSLFPALLLGISLLGLLGQYPQTYNAVIQPGASTTFGLVVNGPDQPPVGLTATAS